MRARVLLLLVSALAIPAGCISTADEPDGEALFVLVQERFTVTWPGGEPPHANVGPHCAPASYRMTSPRAELTTAGTTVPEAFLVHHVDRDSVKVVTQGRVGSDGVRLFLGKNVTLPSPFDGNRSLLHIEVKEGNVLVNGTTLQPGEAREVRAEFDVTSEGIVYHVTEFLTVRNLGKAEVYLKAPGKCM